MAALNRGCKYPLAIKNGGLALSEDLDLVKEGIFSILQTEVYERVMRPTYGVPDRLFSLQPDFSRTLYDFDRRLNRQIFYQGVRFQVDGGIDEDGTGTVTVVWDVDGIPQLGLQIPQRPVVPIVLDTLDDQDGNPLLDQVGKELNPQQNQPKPCDTPELKRTVATLDDQQDIPLLDEKGFFLLPEDENA